MPDQLRLFGAKITGTADKDGNILKTGYFKVFNEENTRKLSYFG
jgi:hypothetical protein